MAIPESRSELARRLELARLGYGEVLDATKHQDDKVGRFLTGVAFLTTAAVAYTVGFDIAAITYALGPWELPLPALLAGGYLVLVVITVILLIMALGPNLGVPGRPSGPDDDGDYDSNLYFMAISARSQCDFLSAWGNSKSIGYLEDQTVTNLLEETHNIATKVRFKYHRTNEARAVFSFALILLGLAIVLGGYPKLDTSRAPGPVAWTIGPRLAATALIAATAYLLSYDYLRLAQKPGFDKDRVTGLAGLAAGAPLFVLGTGIPSEGSGFWAVAAIVFQLAGAALCSYSMIRLKRQWLCRVVAVIWAVGVVAAAFVAYGQDGWEPVLIVVALAVVVALELPRLLGAHFSWVRMKNRMRGQTPDP